MNIVVTQVVKETLIYKWIYEETETIKIGEVL